MTTTAKNRAKDRKTEGQIGKRLLSARVDAPDFRDFIYQPALLMLKSEMSVPKRLKIRDQGKSSACTGFGLAATIDVLIRKSRNNPVSKKNAVSSLMLYDMARRYDEWAGEDDQGSSCRGAIKGWYNMGVCTEQLYAFDEVEPAEFTIEAAKDARNRTIGAYYRLGNRISDYHAALNETGAIFCSAEIHDGWEQVNKETGLIELQSGQLGAHAFSIVGYNKKGFWIQNSWGKDWASNGVALWTYEDWRIHVQDAWVFRLALPTPQIWHLPEKNNINTSSAERAPSPNRAEIAGHFVHIDDGCFHENGRYWSKLDDVKMTAEMLAESDDYDHLLFYAHGGLNSPEASASRIAAMKETFKNNRIYPYHLMYDTGIVEELKDVIFGHRKKAEARAGGFKDWLDKIIEKTTRVPGRAMWREMKHGASSPFVEVGAGSQTLAAFVQAFAASGKPKKIHMVGHSTGMILLSHLIQRLSVLSPGTPVASLSLMAPAGTLNLFTSHLQDFLKAPYPDFRISEMRIYNLKDDLEQDDQVTKAYNKSLLYLVSRAFEEDIPARLLGLENDSKLIERRDISRLRIYYSEGPVPGARVTSSESHGGFDNDVLTMNHILKNMLKKEPVEKFTQDSLNY